MAMHEGECMSDQDDRSLSDEATFAGRAPPGRAEVSLSDERTLGGADADMLPNHSRALSMLLDALDT